MATLLWESWSSAYITKLVSRGRERGREGGREGEREGGREGEREGGRERGREREREREGGYALKCRSLHGWVLLTRLKPIMEQVVSPARLFV